MRKLLVVVDMQNDFIEGSLGTKEAEAIVDNVVKVIGSYNPKDIFATRDTHPEKLSGDSGGKKSSSCSLCKKHSGMGAQ